MTTFHETSKDSLTGISVKATYTIRVRLSDYSTSERNETIRVAPIPSTHALGSRERWCDLPYESIKLICADRHRSTTVLPPPLARPSPPFRSKPPNHLPTDPHPLPLLHYDPPLELYTAN
ncbi:hypothetical protein J6590_068741 [Homalodisca vitripennis]|nr:hypothetical protein J6590_068741 [Homalodisca vitripennis]